jgi:hypothetical protein
MEMGRMRARGTILERGAVGSVAALFGLTSLVGCKQQSTLIELHLSSRPNAAWHLADIEAVDQNPYQNIEKPVSFVSFRPASLQPLQLGLQANDGTARISEISVRLGDAAVVGHGNSSTISARAWFAAQLSTDCWMLPLPEPSHDQARFSEFRLDPTKRKPGNAAGCPHFAGGEQYLLARNVPSGDYDALIRCGDGATVTCRMTIFHSGWKVEITFHRRYLEAHRAIEAAVLSYVTKRTRAITALE